MKRSQVAERLWTRDFVLSIAVIFLISLVFYLLMTTMALYAAERFAARDSMAGLASSIFIIGATVARLAGSLVDRLGRRRLLLISLGVFVVATASYIPAGSLGLLLGIRFVHGIAFGVASTAAIAIAQSLIPPSRRGEGTGYFSVGTTLGTALGPLLALSLVHGPGYPALFAVSATAGALALAVTLVLRAPEVRIDPVRQAAMRRFRPANLLEPAVLPIAGFMLLMGAGYSGVLAFLSSYAQQLDLTTAASSFFLVYAVVVLVSRLIAGRIQDGYGDNVVVYPATVAFALGMLLLACATSNLALVAAGGVIGLGFGTLMSALQAAAVNQVPADRIGLAVSTFYFMLDVGTGFGPVLLGWLVQATAYPTMYLVVAVVIAASSGLYHLLHGRKRRVGAPVAEVRAADLDPALRDPLRT